MSGWGQQPNPNADVNAFVDAVNGFSQAGGGAMYPGEIVAGGERDAHMARILNLARRSDPGSVESLRQADGSYRVEVTGADPDMMPFDATGGANASGVEDRRPYVVGDDLPPFAIQGTGFTAHDSSLVGNFTRGLSGNGGWSVLEGERPLSYSLGNVVRTGLGLIYDGLTGAGDFGAAGQAFEQGNYVTAAMYGLRGGATAALTAMTAGDYALAKASMAGVAGSAGLRVGTRDAADYGVAFFGDSNLSYYTRETATLGREGKSFFYMPLEDSGVVRNAADAARYTGRAPSAEQAYMNGKDIYGLSFPTQGMKVSVPSAADAGGWPHFLEGGHTAVRLGDGPRAGYLVNPTRELVVPGGSAMPSSSVLFKLGPNGEWIPVRRF